MPGFLARRKTLSSWHDDLWMSAWLASNCALRHPVITIVDTHTHTHTHAASCCRHHDITIIAVVSHASSSHHRPYLLMTSFDKCPLELRNLRFEIIRFCYNFYFRIRSPILSDLRSLRRSANTDDVTVSDVTKVWRRFRGFSWRLLSTLRERLQTNVTCQQNLITSRVHHNTFVPKISYQFSFFLRGQTDRQTNRHRQTDRQTAG